MSKSPEIRRDVITNKKLKGEKLTLDEKWADEADAIKPLLKEHQSDMLYIKDWLYKNFNMKLSKGQFQKLGEMFCDGIIMPRLI